MKAYVGTKKVNDKSIYGLTIYADNGTVLYSSIFNDVVSPNKFENALKAIEWSAKKIRVLVENKVLNEEEPVFLIIGSKTIYSWFFKEVAPEPYTVLMSDTFLEMSFFLNRLEILLSQNGDKRVLYKNSTEDKNVKVTDLFPM